MNYKLNKKRVKKFNYFLYKYLNDYKEIIKSYKIYKKTHISILKLNFLKKILDFLKIFLILKKSS